MSKMNGGNNVPSGTPDPNLLSIYDQTFKNAALPQQQQQQQQQQQPRAPWQQQQFPPVAADEFGGSNYGGGPQDYHMQPPQPQQQQQHWSYSEVGLDFPGVTAAAAPGDFQQQRYPDPTGLISPPPPAAFYQPPSVPTLPNANVQGFPSYDQHNIHPSQQLQQHQQYQQQIPPHVQQQQQEQWNPASYSPAPVSTLAKVKTETPSSVAPMGHMEDALKVLESHAHGGAITPGFDMSPVSSLHPPSTPDSNGGMPSPALPPPAASSTTSGRGRGRGRGRGSGTGAGPGRKVKKESGDGVVVGDPSLKEKKEKDRRFSNNTRERMRIRDINEALNELGQLCKNLYPEVNTEAPVQGEDESKPTTKLGVLNNAVEVIMMLEKKVKAKNMNPGQLAVPMSAGMPPGASMGMPGGHSDSGHHNGGGAPSSTGLR